MMQEVALKTIDLMSRVFTGKSIEENAQDSLKSYARSRLREAHELCAAHGIDIPIGSSFIHTPELLQQPALQNYLHQLGFADATHGVPAQTSEPHYMLGYREGRQYE